MGVGTDIDSIRLNNGTATLVVQDYFKLAHDGTNKVDLTHLKYNTDHVEFYPETTAKDLIGTTTNRWKEGHFSH